MPKLLFCGQRQCGYAQFFLPKSHMTPACQGKARHEEAWEKELCFLIEPATSCFAI